MNLMTGKRNKKSMGISLGVHLGLIALGLIPFASQIDYTEDFDEMLIVPVVFAENQESSSSSSSTSEAEAIKEIAETTVEEVVEETVIEEIIEEVIVEEESPVEAEPEVIEEPQEIIEAEEEAEIEEVAETSEETAGTAEEEAEDSGTGGTADGDSAGDGAEADGVITRKIIHREDIAEAADHSGTIVVDICIDRRGRILTVMNNGDLTTIKDVDMIRKALEIATMYRFETDFEAAKRECGSLTFIFDVESDTEDVRLLATAE